MDGVDNSYVRPPPSSKANSCSARSRSVQRKDVEVGALKKRLELQKALQEKDDAIFAVQLDLDEVEEEITATQNLRSTKERESKLAALTTKRKQLIRQKKTLDHEAKQEREKQVLELELVDTEKHRDLESIEDQERERDFDVEEIAEDERTRKWCADNGATVNLNDRQEDQNANQVRSLSEDSVPAVNQQIDTQVFKVNSGMNREGYNHTPLFNPAEGYRGPMFPEFPPVGLMAPPGAHFQLQNPFTHLPPQQYPGMVRQPSFFPPDPVPPPPQQLPVVLSMEPPQHPVAMTTQKPPPLQQPPDAMLMQPPPQHHVAMPMQQPPPNFQQRPPPQFQQQQPQAMNPAQALQQQNVGGVSMEQLVTALQGIAGPRTSGHGDRDLPIFSGKPEDWLGFKSQYDRTTMEYRLTPCDNLQRLRKALKGPALDAVKFFFNTPDNVPYILTTLQFEFGRPELIIKSLIQNAETTPRPDPNKPETVIVFSRAVQSLVATIRSHSQQGYLDSVYLLDKLVDRLPPAMLRSWRMFLLQGRSKSLETFQDYIVFEKTMAGMGSSPAIEEKSGDKPEFKRKRGPAVVNTTTTTEQDVCPCCLKPGHQVNSCRKFETMPMDDRWKLTKLKRICITCLKTGHRSRDCRKKSVCGIDGCTYHHNKILHSAPRSKSTTTPVDAEEALPAGAAVAVVAEQEPANTNFVRGCDGPLPIIPIRIRSPDGKVLKTYALLDGGSSTSLVLKSLANKLSLGGPTLSYTCKGVGGSDTDPTARRVTCEVAGISRGEHFGVVRGAVAVDKLPTSDTIYSIDVERIKQKWPHLQNVPAKSLKNVVAEVIIGNNNPHLILARKIVMGKDDEPWGWKTQLGWTISGNFYGDSGAVNSTFGAGYPTNEYLHNLIKSSFSIDDLGVKITTAKGINVEERRALQILETTTRKVGDSWECGLLWREDNVVFLDTELFARKRLEAVERKMSDPQFKEQVNAKINEYIAKGYARKLTPQEARSRKPNTYIIPTFGVLNPNKPGKFRLVMDARAKINGVSLNDKLLKGPDLIRPLTAVLWNWRRFSIAITGDIADMFHRVKIREEDCDSQRFLWRYGDRSRQPDHYRMEVMVFGATSSPASAIFVKDWNAKQFQQKYPAAVNQIRRQFYVDDALLGGDSEQEVIELRQQVTEICQAGNFKICKWLSNSTAVLRSIPEDLKADGVKGLADKEDIEGERVLGLWWDPQSDSFQFRLGLHKVKKEVLSGEIPTKREMCGLIMSLYDPLGFITPYKIKGHILLQQVWNSGVGWDDEIPADIFGKWKTWLARLEGLQEVQVPRCYFRGMKPDGDIQLHVFVDASSEAYSSVAYLRYREDDCVDVSFLSGKARVAPLKKSTIPRLELLAALMGARLATSIGEELEVKISRRFFWSDSSTVLQWLRSPAAKLKEFVANRIGEIQESTNTSEWHWVPTKINVADVATRMESELSFSPESVWLKGPSFLLGPEETWNFEQKRKDSQCTEGLVSTVVAIPKRCSTLAVPSPQRFSTYIRFQRATAGLIRIMRYLKSPSVGRPWYRHPDGTLTSRIESVDMRAADVLICKFVQEETFGEELNKLRNNKPIDNKSSLWRLSPTLNSAGLLCISGRISRAEGVSEEMKRPVILPSHHPVSDLLVDWEHKKNAHQGAKTIEANLQQKFWVIGIGHAVNRSFARCWVCKLKRVKPTTPRMAELPSFRLAHHEPPFTNVGIDLFGPIFVTVGRRHEKRWGVVVCCLTTRAVYLDVVHDISTDELIMAISRFIDTRLRPSLIVCDNGTNLVGSERTLREAWTNVDFDKIRSYGRFVEISWLFNPAAAPHMGGAWESFVKLAKKCLTSILHEKAPRDTTLLTALKGAENMMNSRPITAVSPDPTDPEALTPNHFVRGICGIGPAIPAGEAGSAHVREKWLRSQQLQELFWKRWTSEFLPKLIKREKWLESVKPLEVGALVYIVDDHAPMKCWRKGFISQVFTSKDGQVRSVEVTMRDFTTRKETKLRRPTVKICPLGLSIEIRKEGSS